MARLQFGESTQPGLHRLQTFQEVLRKLDRDLTSGGRPDPARDPLKEAHATRLSKPPICRETAGWVITRASAAAENEPRLPTSTRTCSVHVDRLDEAIAGARALLKSGGVLVADEFAWERADRTTSAWFYDAAALLEAAGVLNREHVTAIDDPLRQWVRRHRDEDPMHMGRAMIDAIADRLELLDRDRVPYLYLYRCLGGWLTDDTVGVRAFAALHDLERRHVADGSLAPVGLRLHAQR